MTLRFFDGPTQWIYLPKKVEISTSLDGKKFTVLSQLDSLVAKEKVSTSSLLFEHVETHFLKIKAENYGTIPDGNEGAGHKAWLFVDEIVVK